MKIVAHAEAMDELLVDLFLEAHAAPPAETALLDTCKVSQNHPSHGSHRHKKAFFLLNSTDLHNLIRLMTSILSKIHVMAKVVRNAG